VIDSTITKSTTFYDVCLFFSSLYSQALLDYFYPQSDWTLLEYSTKTDEKGGETNFCFDLRIKRQWVSPIKIKGTSNRNGFFHFFKAVNGGEI
jgi:hypothetical protein